MDKSDPLLLPLFNYLRRYGVPLGVGEYLLALETLRQARGLDDLESVKFTCRLLWAKSRDDQELFDVAFAHLVEPQLRPVEAASEPPGDSSSTTAMDRDQSGSESSSARHKARDTGLPSTETSDLRLGTLPVMARLGAESGDTPCATGTYQLTPRPPITEREIASVWRYLRRLQRQGPQLDLDVQGTVADICRTGFLHRPLMQARRRNQARLVVLIDRYGSMAPFDPLVGALVDGINRGGLRGRVSYYYFHNYPSGYLSPDPGLINSRPIADVLPQHPQSTSDAVLVVSDGGAARQAFRADRVDRTRAFLKTLSCYTYLYAWLNPLPQYRWEATTAEDVARMVPMFPLDREGLIDTVNILRGHPFPPGVGIDVGHR